MYKDLLLCAGGGIISDAQKAEKNEAVTIAIGLGGTGIDCLKTLKKEVYTRLKPDRTVSGVPQYDHIKFLAVDSDRGNTVDSGIEFFDISFADIGRFTNCPEAIKINPSLQWFRSAAVEPDGTGICIPDCAASSGGVRQVGRLLFFLRCDAFIHRLQSLITEARCGLPAGAEHNIHIFTGLGGGTGSGIFLDVCYLTQYALSTLGITAPIHGYFFTPDVNISKTVCSATQQEYIKSNAFAAMKELDYCMNLEQNGGEWDQLYNGITVKTTRPPVNFAYLISAENESGTPAENAYDSAMQTVAEYIMALLVRSDEYFCMRPQFYPESLNPTAGASYKYCILGSASSYIPYKSIMTYLASKTFESFKCLKNQLPTSDDTDLFIDILGLKYQDIVKEVGNNLPVIPAFDIDHRALYEQTAGIFPHTIPQSLSYMQDFIPKTCAKLNENKHMLLDEGYPQSLISRIKEQLSGISADPQKGPYYACALLHTANTADLLNKIDSYILKNRNDLMMAKADLTLRDKDIEIALQELQQSNFINRKYKASNYVQTVSSHYRHQAMIELYTVTDELLELLRRRLTELYTSFYAPFTDVMRTLETTFDANLNFLERENGIKACNISEMITVNDLKDTLDSAVNSINTNSIIPGFVTYMMNSPELLDERNEKKISAAVSGFFINEFRSFTNKTVNDFLEFRFQTADPAIISYRVYNDILLPTANMAQPMFKIDSSKYKSQTEFRHGFCSIPMTSEPINDAAHTFSNHRYEINARPCYDDGRINITVLGCGVPMFAYGGLDDCKKARSSVGRHIYEGAVGDSRDWRCLPDITPFSLF